MNIKLIIFDCDGVLVDSEPISNKIFSLMLNEKGIDINTFHTEKLFKGKSMFDCRRIVEEKFKLKLTDRFIKEFRKRTFDAFRKDLKPIEGIKTSLDELNYHICVASSGPPQKIRLNLKITNLLKYFGNNIFSATELKKGKPDPEIFLYAAAKMGIDRKNCVVVEDSIPGVEAGIAANMKVLFYTKSFQKNNFENIIYFNEMKNLPKLISDIEKNNI